ncbi:helix-turn-helix transcriptional regulator [Streptomyces zhihengii]|uniref:AAA family ATPase n=1 Tax=Streptomyces zhihengii TaxID=1818004 RepID=A0ABS2V0Y1_9ACTN|nr:LuxR family transcriptional regulator [Streptomyces zhihengii]MBM9623495.1 AAA family ATPase [Streptomyces zhihengii]
MLHHRGSAGSDVTPLIDRQHHIQILDDACRECQKNNGGLLLVEGRFGTGKTSLLRAVRSLPSVEGFTVLHARGNETESGFSYGLVRQLFEYLLAAASPEERRALLAGPAAMAAPLFEYTDGGVHGEVAPDREQALLRGLYWMLVNLSQRRPVLVLVDDLHWADEPSLRFLQYIECRLEQHPILCVAVTAPVHHGNDPDAEHVITLPSMPALCLDDLSRDGVRDLLAAVFNRDPDPDVVRMCHEVTGGNPFFLNELLIEIQRQGDEAPGAGAAARTAPRTLARALPRWVGLVPPRYRDNANVLARSLAVLCSSGDFAQLASATGLHQEEVTDAASALMDIGLLAHGTPLRFRHPIVRNAVYEHLPSTFRFRAHSSAAKALDRDGAPAEHVAEHLLHAPPSEDRRAVDILVAAGEKALAGGNATVAVSVLRRAMQEKVPDDMLPDLLIRLGEAEHRARDPRAVEHLTQAMELTQDPVTRASIAFSLSGALSMAMRFGEALDVLRGVHAEVEPHDRELAVRLRSELIKLASLSPNTKPAAEQDLAAIVGAGGTEGSATLIRAQQAQAALLNGEPADKVARLSEDSVLPGTLVAEPDGGAQASWIAAFCLFCCGRLTQALGILDEALQEAEAKHLRLAAEDIRALRALVNMRRGALGEAEVDALSALKGISGGDSVPALGRPLAVLALVGVLLRRNQVGAAVEAYERYGIPAHIPQFSTFLPFMVARGQIRIAQGEVEAGMRDLLRTHELLHDWGAKCPALSPSTEAVHALCDLGRREEAHALAEEQLDVARAFGSDREIALVLCARARATRGAMPLEDLEQAVELLGGTADAVDECAALIQYGTALRVAGQPAEARRRLRAASDLADGMGATALSKQARQELAVMGVRVRETARTGISGLTPREHRVCLLAAEGKRNQEIAHMLFVTVKTVEWHLSQVYRKLGVASRIELRDALTQN